MLANQKKRPLTALMSTYYPGTFFMKSENRYVETFMHRGDNNGKIGTHNVIAQITYLLEQLLYNRYRCVEAILWANFDIDTKMLLKWKAEIFTDDDGNKVILPGMIYQENILLMSNPAIKSHHLQLWEKMITRINVDRYEPVVIN